MSYVDHGRRHLPGGTDPIPGLDINGIRFDFDNEGGYLQITVNDTVSYASLDRGMAIVDKSGGGFIFDIRDPDDDSLLGRISMREGRIIVDATDNLFLRGRAGGPSVTLTDDLIQIDLVSAGVDAVEVRDHNGDPVFRIDEDGDLHGKTGKTLTFDL